MSGFPTAIVARSECCMPESGDHTQFGLAPGPDFCADLYGMLPIIYFWSVECASIVFQTAINSMSYL